MQFVQDSVVPAVQAAAAKAIGRAARKRKKRIIEILNFETMKTKKDYL
jgi:hypothetical protein